MRPGAFSVPTLHRAVDGERWNQRERGIRKRGTEALLVGKTTRTPVSNRSAKRKSLEQAVFVLLPRVEAHTPDHFRLVSRIVGQDTLAVECPHPILHDPSGNVSANHGARAAEGCGH